jgi:GH25 family lysozyme M1 (1,4-beta-N-acetylmuramidase)
MGKTKKGIYSCALFSVIALVALLLFSATPAQAVSQGVCSSWVQLIDISDNQVHPINWSELAKSGTAGVYIKNSEGASYVNEYWKTDTTYATKYGLPWGGYYFAQPQQLNAVASAKFFVKSGGASGILPPALDIEVSKLSGPATAQWAYDWLNEVRYLTNRTPIIYTGSYYGWSDDNRLGGFSLWLAAYPLQYKTVTNLCRLPLPYLANPWSKEGWSIWQFTSVAYVYGIQNHVDRSVAVSSWWTQYTGAGVQAPVPGTSKLPSPIYTTSSHGPAVVAIQTLLIAHKLLPAGSADGVFGPATKTSVEKWQVIIGVTPDGEWSASTAQASSFYLSHGIKMSVYNAMLVAGSAMKGNN